MKKLPIVVLLMAFLFGCETETLSPAKTEIASLASESDDFTDAWDKASSAEAGARGFSDDVFKDGSGKVKIKLFYKKTSVGQTHSDYVHVDDSYVLIGGAAWVSAAGTSLTTGAFLTESRPETFDEYKMSSSANNWRASSEDHPTEGSPKGDSHILHIVGIGLKLAGVSAADLREYVQYTQSTSCYPSTNPWTEVWVPEDHVLVGGGAKVNPYYYYDYMMDESEMRVNNFIVDSYPNGSEWVAVSKSHNEYAPATVTGYAISIQRDIPGFGSLEAQVLESYSYVNSGVAQAQSKKPNGWVISSIGASSNYDGESAGRPIMGMQIDPLARQGRAISKDLGEPLAGGIYLYTTLIKKAQ